MNLEQQKKLVAEKLMGWVIKPHKDYPSYIIYEDPKNKENWDCFADWEPYKCRDDWPEIWEKIEQRKLEGVYITQIIKPIEPDEILWPLHTAPPEICWKALINTLKGN